MHLQIPVGNMPINVILIADNRTVAFVKVQLFEALLDQPETEDKVGAFFYPEGFSLFQGEAESVDFEYNTAYPYYQIEIMKSWLIQQNLQLPVMIM